MDLIDGQYIGKKNYLAPRRPQRASARRRLPPLPPVVTTLHRHNVSLFDVFYSGAFASFIHAFVQDSAQDASTLAAAELLV